MSEMYTGGCYMCSPVDHSENVRLCMKLAQNDNKDIYRYSRNKANSFCLTKPPTPYANRSTSGFTGGGAFEPHKSSGILNYCSLQDPNLDDYFARKFSRMLSPNLPLRNIHYSSLEADKLGLRSNSFRHSSYLSKHNQALYRIAVTTADIKGAGTSIPVYISIRGDKANCPRTRLIKPGKTKKKQIPQKFSPGTTQIFPIRCADLGDLECILIEHDGLEPKDSWLLQGVEIMNTHNKKIWMFTCNHWLSLYKEDGKVSRELFAFKSVRTKYEIVVVTGNTTDAGTDSKVFITLCGRTGVSPQIPLEKANTACFQRGQSHKFIIPATCVGPISKIRIRIDESGSKPSWYLDRICITDLKNPEWRYYFQCKNWLSRSHGDRAIVREIRGSKEIMGIATRTVYKISFYTGSKPGAGTRADIFIQMFGENGDSDVINIKNRDGIKEGSIFEHETPMKQLGALKKVKVGHNNQGPHPNWYLNKIIISDLELSRVFEFPCEFWLSNTDGETLEKMVPVKKLSERYTNFKYDMKITTSNRPKASTTSNVYVILSGPEAKDKILDKIECSGKIWIKNAKFIKGCTDVVPIELPQKLSPLTQIVAGIEPSGKKPDWFLEDIVVFCAHTGIEQSFICGNWLSSTKQGCNTEVTLVEDLSKRKIKTIKDTWVVSVQTSDIKHGGTSAKVTAVLYGSRGKSDDIAIPTEYKLEQNSTYDFRTELISVGLPYKLRVQHNNTGVNPAWHLDKILMTNVSTGDIYLFECKRWLSDSHDDNSVIREIPASGPGIMKPASICNYKIQVYTGNKAYAGTDANVFINIFGDKGDTGDRFLTQSSTNMNKFEKGKMDDFSIEAVALGKINKIRLGHDSLLGGSGWYVDKVIIWEEEDPTNSMTFRCNCWFDSAEGDGLTVRELTGTALLGKVTYDIEVRTGKSTGAGTDSNVFIRIFGSIGDTGNIQLKTSATNKNKFETGATDLFKIESEDIGEIKSIRLSHDNKGAGADWLVDQVCIIVPKLGSKYIFLINKWMNKKNLEIDADPSKIEKIDKTIPYQITVFTADIAQAGTDANVFIQIYGKEKKTDQLDLKSNSNTFERGSEDMFKINANDVGKIQKIRIGHDGKNPGAGWYLDKLLIERLGQSTELEAKPKNKLKRSLAFSSEESLDSFEDSVPTLKRSNSNRSDQEEKEIERYWFLCNRWLATDEDDGMIVRELLPTDDNGKSLSDLKEIGYTVVVKTGKEHGAGTDANVFLTIYGKNGDSGERALKNTINSSANKFEESSSDQFLIKAVDLGTLNKIKLRHDNSSTGPAWYVDYVLVNDDKDEYLFPCYSWLAKDKDDGLISRDIFPANASIYQDWKNGQLSKDKFKIYQEDQLETYLVKVYTTKKLYAGSDSNVHIILYGEDNDSGFIPLKQSTTHSNKFESGNCDEFIVKSADLGELKKIKIGHDNSAPNSDWHLSKVEVEAQKLGQSYVFPCNEWISSKKGDGKLERELYPQTQLTMTKRPKIKYEITTHTSNRNGAGTKANVYIQIYGRNDCTEKKNLANPTDKQKFEKGAIDTFYIALEDVDDPIEKIRIGHDGKGIGAGWHLEKVLVTRLLSDKNKSLTYEFPCNRWLARDEEDGAIERELLPEKTVRKGSVDAEGHSLDKVESVASILQKKIYSIVVYTGDHTGTNANVFMKVYGETSDSGERQLVDSKTHSDKFEKNNIDEFEWEAVDLGKLYKLEIRHDNSGLLKKDWFLKKVEIIDKYDNETYVFHCERWLSKSKDDKKIQRTLYVVGYQGERSTSSIGRSRSVYSGGGSAASFDSQKDDSLSGTYRFEMDDDNDTHTESIPYTITVVTGPEKNMGSSGPFWIKFYGAKDLKTSPIYLNKLGSDYFAPGSKEIMSIEASNVGDIKKVEIANEGIDRDSSWYLNSITVEMPTLGKLYNITCGTWLSKFEGERTTSRIYNIQDKMMTKIIKKMTYTISVITGDVEHGGTNSSLFLQLFGTTGNSSVYPLDKNNDNFERGQRDMFKLEMEDVGIIKRIRIENEADGDRPDWFLEKIDIRNEKSMDFYEFEYNEFLSRNLGQKKRLVVDLAPINDSKKTSYKICVKTSDLKSAGTSSDVFVKLYGTFGDSGELALKNPEQPNKPFKINQLDEFVFPDLLVLGDLNRCQVWHNNSGFSSKWHLDYIEVKEMNSRRSWKFLCNKWLSLADDDKQIFRELLCENTPTKKIQKESQYEITVITGDKKNAGMPHNAWFVFYGEKNYSDKFIMENSDNEKLFSRSNEDKRKFTCPYLGELKSLKFGAVINKHETHSDRRKWYCHEVQVKDLITLNTYIFEIKLWIDVMDTLRDQDGKIFDSSRVDVDINKSRIEEIKKKGVIKYEVLVTTGKGVGCGTNANVFITLYGEHADSGKRSLIQKGRDLFEQGQEDKFVLECIDLGALQKIKIEHDDSGMRSDWFLERIQISNLSNNSVAKFNCQEWLSKSKGLWKMLTPN